MKWAALWARPILLWEAALTAWAFRRRGGLLPSRALFTWRVATAYGTGAVAPTPEDVTRFLEWRRTFRSYRRRAR